jgi:two-component system, NtrC family, sensor kinase
VTVTGKLLAIVVFVAIAPLAVFAFTAMRVHERALDADVLELHRKTAESGAREIEASLDAARRTTGGLVRAIPWAALSAEERRGALELVYQQLEDVAAVTLLDDGGRRLDSVADDAGRHHPPLAAAIADAFVRAIPIADAREHGSATGAAIAVADDSPIVPLAFAIPRGDAPAWTLAVALSLRAACGELHLASSPAIAVRLEDAAGRLLCGEPAPAGELVSASAEAHGGWRVVAEQSREHALASTRSIRDESLVWAVLGAAAAIASGLVLAQAIRRPLRRLAAGSEAIARGDYAHRIGHAAHDEFGALADSFDRMTGELERKDAELRAWNDELQGRVDARTAELKDAQDQLLQSRKLGAMAALTAGVAHELNNPLAGVLGLAQLMRGRSDLDERAHRSLASIEREATRIRDIVAQMSSLAQDTVSDAVPLDVPQVVAAAIDELGSRLADGQIVVERALGERAPRVRGNAAQLQQALSQLVDNSLKAMPSGGTLRLAVRAIEDELVAIEVADTGRGIAPELLDKIFEPFFTTKDDWRGVGLGLTVAQRIVEAHHGRIRATSRVGAGTTMTITLPVMRRGSHLS